MENVVIIGSGPAGLTAAIYLARADLSPVVLAGEEWGGQLMGTSDVENFPGFPEGIMGPQLMMNMLKQAEKFGAKVVYKQATEVVNQGDTKTVFAGEDRYDTKSVVLALGSSPRKLNIPGETEFWGKGVSTCATCDGALYREKVVGVVGGGDSAMEEASFISKFASKVYLIHRKNEFRASKVMQDRVLSNDKIEVMWNTEVKEVVGDGIVTGVKTFNNVDNTDSHLDVDGFFLAIGHIPNTDILNDLVDLDDSGFIDVKGKSGTSVEGIFFAGDVADHNYQQAITAAGMGCMAAIDTERWLQDQ